MNELSVVVENAPSPPVTLGREALRAGAEGYLRRHPEPVLEIQGDVPVDFREALFDALADEGVPIVQPLANRVSSDVWRAHCGARPGRCDATDMIFRQSLAAALLGAVHDLAVYRPDPVKGYTDFVSRVGETLRPRRKTGRSEITGQMRGAGDCEDLTILYIAMARALGFRANALWIQQDGAFQNHVAAAVYVPTQFSPSGAPLWAETTIPGARVGEHPYIVVERLGHQPRLFGGSE